MILTNLIELFNNCSESNQMKVSCNKNYSVHVLKSMKGDKVETHYHVNWSESWYIIEGQFKIWIDNGKKVFVASQGDFIQIDEKIKHNVETISKTAKRLAIFRDDVEIIYGN